MTFLIDNDCIKKFNLYKNDEEYTFEYIHITKGSNLFGEEFDVVSINDVKRNFGYVPRVPSFTISIERYDDMKRSYYRTESTFILLTNIVKWVNGSVSFDELPSGIRSIVEEELNANKLLSKKKECEHMLALRQYYLNRGNELTDSVRAKQEERDKRELERNGYITRFVTNKDGKKVEQRFTWNESIGRFILVCELSSSVR